MFYELGSESMGLWTWTLAPKVKEHEARDNRNTLFALDHRTEIPQFPGSGVCEMLPVC